MALSNSYNVFLETFNRGALEKRASTLVPAAKPGAESLSLSEETLRPVIANLAKQSDPVEVAQLASVANVKLTPLVVALQQLSQAGIVDYNQNTDAVKLTDIGRQMINVGKML